jgi:hypothetical protein
LTEDATQAAESDSSDQDLNKIGKWWTEIKLYDREAAKFNQRRKNIVKRYKDDRDDATREGRRFNILWSNTQTLLPTLYARNPKPDIQRRFKDADPVGRVTSDVLERCVTYFCDTDKFSAVMRQCALDYLLPGRGTAWVRYVPHMKPAEEITDDKNNDDAPEAIDYEDVEVDHVHAEDFGCNYCRTWEEVWLVWRRVYMDRAELVKRFPEKGIEVPLDHGNRDDSGKYNGQLPTKATIYEAWDKTRKVAVWFHKDMPEALDVRDDPLQLDGFFPCPKPLLANLANDSIIPTADYYEYQDQAAELDSLTARSASITKSLKVVGVYDASAQGLDRLLSEGVENQLIPVENWAIFAEKGGIKGAISLLPLQDIVAGLTALYEARSQVKADLYEITGIADIIRGNSQAEETATAQAIKSQFATMRISDRQRDVQRFVRETIRIMVDIICGHFQFDTIKKVSGVRLLQQAEKQQISAMIQAQQQPPLPPGVTADQLETMMSDPSWEDVEQLVHNQPMRCFRIDIETDSTIKADEEAEKASRIEFLKASGEFLQQASNVGAQQPELVPLLAQMLMFGVRAFPIGKELEGSFNSAIQKLEKQAASGQPKPSPEMQKVQADMQISQQKLQAEQQAETARIQMQERSDRQAQAEAQREMVKLDNEFKARIAIAHIDAAAKIEVARITAGSDDGAEAEAREVSGEGGEMVQSKQPADGARPGDPLPAWIQAGMGGEPPAQSPIPDADTRRMIQQHSAQTGAALKSHAQGIATLTEAMKQMAAQHQQLAANVANLALAHHKSHGELLDALTAEKEVVRDKDGKAAGVRVKRKEVMQ